MDKNRLITIALIAAMVGIVVLGWLSGISPLLDQASAARNQASALKTANDANSVRIAGLKVQFENIDELETDLKVVRRAIPANIKMPVFLREINAFTAQYGVTLTSVAVSEAQEWMAPDAGVTDAPVTPDATGSDAAAAPVPPTANGLVVIPVRVIVSGPYANVMAFLGALQQGPRLYLMNSIGVAPGGDGFSATMDGLVYALPSDGADVVDEDAPEIVSTVPAPAPSPTPTEDPGVSDDATEG